MTWGEWFLTHAIVFAAFALRGLTGFGSALVMTPLLTLFMDLRQTVILTAVLSILNGFGIAYYVRGEIARRTFALTSVSALVGLVVGTYLLVTQPNVLLKRGVGVMTILFAAGLFRRDKGSFARTRPWPESAGLIAGLLSGVLGGLFGTSGPPMIVYMSRRGMSVAVFRATLIAFFCVLDVSRMLGYAASGLVTRQILLTGVLLIPISLLGVYAGTRIHTRLNERFLWMTVAVALLVAGVALVVGR